MSKTYKIGIVGAGTMGSGIAQKMAQEGLLVTLVDIKDEFVQRGFNMIRDTLQEGIDRKIFTVEQVDEIISRIHGTTNMEELADADLVVEAVFEDEKVKGGVFKRLDEICKPHTILASNTSSFYVRNLAKYTNRPDRFIGLHYFYHPAKNRLLEVIPHEGTSKETIDKALLIGKLHGKTTILVKDSPGFAVNRFFIPWYVEAIRILEEGVANIPTIDGASKKAFGIGMGVFELMNVSGVPIGLHAANTLSKEIGSFYAPPELLRKQVEDLKEDWDLSGEVDESKFEIITERLYAAIMGVTATLVQEGVASIEDTDRGAKVGLRWRYGPFELMNRIGIEKAYDLVKKMSERRFDFKIPELLEKQLAKGSPFEFNFVDLLIKDDIAWITINRPEAMNALNSVVVEQLEKKFDEAESDDAVKAIVFQGAGKAFVAGADIKFFVDNIKSDNIAATYAFTKKGHELLLRFENSPKMTIALLDGLSLGGGSEVAMACQAIVATPNGSFGFPETGIGIFPGLGGMIRLERHVGPELAKYYVFTGKTLRAEEALQLGIVTKLVEPAMTEQAIKEVVTAGKYDKYHLRAIPETFNEKKAVCTGENVERLLNGELPQGVSQEFAEKTVKIIAKKAPIAMKMANELIDAQSEVSIEEAIKLELERLFDIFSTKDALAGLQSPPGRPPKYEGK
jgi:enoyl-CoA hydratase/3-hydroxyacyl-CoA dehydrogenase